ncbi:MAG: shikimate dehydrogenase family protein [Ferruginibacter sp.]
MKLFGLIGYPLGHSFSKKYFDKKFKEENITDAEFELFAISSIDEFPNLLQENLSLKGLAVTIPYKQSVLPFINYVTVAATQVGAVNCIKFIDGHTIGHNTDVVGFEKSLAPLLQPQHTKALVLGTGGSSKAVQYVLKQLNIHFLLVSRNKSNVQNCITYNEIVDKIMREYFLIINCTPVGMKPHESGLPAIPYNLLSTKHLLYDLIYAPEKTPFLQQGERLGCTIKNGFEMLVLQAEENWKIWNA